jgi:glyoxylase-like metal-dependent hydrolase (beta-lactamase superfamily II)
VYAFYDGRVDGYRFDDAPNWVDDGALSLGIASYAIVSGDAALVYDTHVSIEHAQRIRAVLEDDGVSYVTVVLSHWHLDHVAGTEAFDGCEVIACERTAEVLTELRPAIESGSLEGPPAIDPLVLPTTTFRERRTLDIGDLRLELIHTEIHSDDAVVVWWPDEGLLFCGDTWRTRSPTSMSRNDSRCTGRTSNRCASSGRRGSFRTTAIRMRSRAGVTRKD